MSKKITFQKSGGNALDRGPILSDQFLHLGLEPLPNANSLGCILGVQANLATAIEPLIWAASTGAAACETKRPRRKGAYKISRRMLSALESLASGAAENLEQAGQISGLTERAIRYAIAKPHVRDWLREHVQSTFAAGQLSAARTMLGLLKSENSMSQFRAASWLMGVSGIAPVDTRGPLVNIGVTGSGFVIDLREPHEQSGPLGERDQAALGAVRDQQLAGAVLLGSRTVDGPMIDAT